MLELLGLVLFFGLYLFIGLQFLKDRGLVVGELEEMFSVKVALWPVHLFKDVFKDEETK